MMIMYSEGVVSKLKINFINDLLGDDFEGVCRGLCALKKNVKKQGNEGKRLKDIIENNKRFMKTTQKIYREPI